MPPESLAVQLISPGPAMTAMLAAVPLWLVMHLPMLVFVFCFGACVGSFTNVVVYRLPAGMSVVSPASRCPTCGAMLRFFRENLPILGWFAIRGRCRYCGAVSPQYMVIELMIALIFVGIYILFFMVNPRTPWWGGIGGSWWFANLVRVWPVYFVFAFLVTGLVAMTLIDARTFTIPIEIPLFITIAAFIAYPLQAILPHRSPPSMDWPIPCVGWQATIAATGGMIGVLASVALLKLGRLRESFADYYDYVEEGEAIGDYPHARREMWVELKFLAPCLLGLVVGYLLGGLAPGAAPPEFVQAVGATFTGYLAGGALIWGIRILGTLAFGREAMGLGDVHLLAAVGAVLGWWDPVWIFFLAPFSGLLWVALSMGLSTVFKMARRELPYGPHLAVATLVIVFCRPGVERVQAAILPGLDLPRPGLVPSPPPALPPGRTPGPVAPPGGTP